MSDNTKNIEGLAIRGTPSKISEGTRGPVRTSQYGEIVTLPIGNFRHTLADQGCYFIAHNPTNDASTTLAGHPAPVLVDADATMTKPVLFLRNSTSASEDIRCYLDFIEIDVVTAGTNGTTSNWAAQLDTGATRVTTAGTTFTTVNPNMQSTATPSLAVQGGVVVTGTESSSVRHLGHGQIRAAIEFAGDRLTFRFGGQPHIGSNVVAGAASRHLITLPPVVLGATDQFLFAMYAPSQSAASVYKVRCGWWEL
jgi:hypothetical protein